VKSLVALALIGSAAWAAIYDPGTVSSTGLTFGTMLTSGAHTSVGGSGFGGVTQFTADGNVLNSGGTGYEGDPDESGRVYMFDQGGLTDLAAGTAHRGSGTFAMMIWDFGQPVTFVRVYPSQDHLTPNGPYADILGGADVMDSSLWGSNDGDNFVLLNDVTGVTPGGVNGQAPTFTFASPNPPTSMTIYRGGSTERGTVNSYAYDVTLATGYRYIGIRASTITIKGTGVGYPDGDVEIDAVATLFPANPPSGGGAYTPGFWCNKNGQAAIKKAGAGVFTILGNLCLVDANGNAFNPTKGDDPTVGICPWIKSTAVNMAYKLSTMLACMELNVNVGVNGKKVDPTQKVYTLGCAGELGVTQITIGDLMAQANAALCANPKTFSDSADRTHQECLKDVLDWANNNLNWVP
jgi:hypothetical protein